MRMVWYKALNFLSFFLFIDSKKCLGFTDFFLKLLVQRRDKMYNTITQTEYTIYKLKKKTTRKITGIVAA
jgi:hypothetical protein